MLLINNKLDDFVELDNIRDALNQLNILCNMLLRYVGNTLFLQDMENTLRGRVRVCVMIFHHLFVCEKINDLINTFH